MNPWSSEEFAEQLQAVGRAQYHDRHPFHRLMNEGKLDHEQLRAWVVNRYYYQKIIPIKDAIILSRCPLREVRRNWIQRIIDHDGQGDHDGQNNEPGGIEKWLRLGEAMGLAREELESERRLLPAVRYSVDAYVNFVSTRPWIEAVASSLTELFAPRLMTTRLAAFEKHYTWIDPQGLAYFRSRPPLATRDSEYGMALVQEHCRSRAEQEKAVAALRFKCDLLWAQLDAIYYHCVQPTRDQLTGGGPTGDRPTEFR